MGFSVIYERLRETKNKIRYEPTSDAPVVGSLYLEKDLAAELGDPERLTVRIEATAEMHRLAA